VSKLIQTLLLAIVGLVVLAAVGPTLSRLITALVPLVLVVGIVVAVLQLVRYYTRS
jgi:tellurite resistance protein TehA-like permease